MQTGYGADLYDGVAKSFGNIFEVKTKRDAETVLVTGLEFYSSVDAMVSYEVWTKEGTWQGFEGDLKSFEKISQGEVRSRGPCDATKAANCNFAEIPSDRFRSVHIKGGGGSRSFYVTLSTKEIMYKRGDATSGTDLLVQSETPGKWLGELCAVPL